MTKKCKGFSKAHNRTCKNPAMVGDYCFFHVNQKRDDKNKNIK